MNFRCSEHKKSAQARQYLQKGGRQMSKMRTIAAASSIGVGVIMAGVFFALGMCMALRPEWGLRTQGIVSGVIGIIGIIVLLPLLKGLK